MSLTVNVEPTVLPAYTNKQGQATALSYTACKSFKNGFLLEDLRHRIF